MARPEPDAPAQKDRAAILAELRQKLAPTAPRAKGGERAPIPAGLLDELLEGGLPRGRLTEVSGPAGRMSLACSALGAATAAGHLCALVDGPSGLDPAALRDAGAALDQVLWIRPPVEQRTAAHVLQIADVAIDGGVFPLVVIYLAAVPGHLAPAAVLRLQQRAAQRGVAVLLLGDAPRLGSAAAAAIRLSRPEAHFRRVPGCRLLLTGVGLQAELVRAPGAPPGRQVQVALSLT